MPVRKDPGLPNLVVLVFVLVIFPAIGFFLRRKWRHAAARREEIKRLLVFASEEAARAEIEATEAYSYTSSPVRSPEYSAWIPPAPVPAPVPALKPVYKCAVCFSPTSTRCAKCKAARYCSGRCQIIHWRQGHKDECRPYVPVKPVQDASSNQEDGKDSKVTSADANQPEVRSTFEPSSSEEYSPFSTPSRSSVETTSISSGDSDDTSENFVTVESSTDSVKVDQTSSTSSSQVDDGPSGPSVSEPTPTSYGPMGGTLNSVKFTIDELDVSVKKHTTVLRNAALNESTSSSQFDDVSNGFSFSEPSTASSYFWGGTLHSEKSTMDELDASDKNTTVLDVSAPNGSGSKKSNDLPKEVLIKSTKPPKYNSETLRPKDVVGDSDLPKSMFKETTVSSSPVKDSNRSLGGIPSANPEKSTHVVNTKSVTSTPLKSTSRLASNYPKSVAVHEERKTSTVKVVDQPKSSKLTRHCSQRAESETAHNYSCKGLFSYEMFVKLYNWKQVQLRPFGLVNCGNSCYANAVLQCLTHTPPLNAYFLQGLHSKACNKRDWCFTCEFEGLILKAKNGSSSLSPIRILSQIQAIGSSLNQGRQEDAHEFLRYAIDTLQSACLKEAGTNTTNSLEEETTLVGLTFGGSLKSKIKCMKCGGKSERCERMMDLTVEIEGNIATLEEALDKFTCTEILDGENKYKCSRCKSYEKAKKTLTLLEAPNVLTIALKRFQSGKYGKLNKSIRFPEILNMAPYVTGTSDKSLVYSLYGVVVHLDVMNDASSGHYVCYVKNVENRWFKMDDNRVKEVDVQSVLTKGAYMLLYARCSPRAPRVIRTLLSRNHEHPKKHKTPTSYELRSPWHVNRDHLTVRHRSLEEESSSSDGSGILSESCSCSTERDSSSMESWDWDHEQNSNSISSSPLWRNLHANSSDSDTSSSSSSSSSFLSPLYSRHPSVHRKDDERLSDSFKVDRLGGRPTNPLETSKPGLRRSTTARVRSE
ncbi:ubiquitin carboxyl-terminal hydrolase 17-like [Bidens hawaiensis]|uniref:ubiquitin carboxyl-terminal hydrolase 17-like n=1 Tax=Bidens hawaiensis TaxID=980011 RepID=UPI00404B059F